LDAEKLIEVHQAGLYYNFSDVISYIYCISVPSIVNPSNAPLQYRFELHARVEDTEVQEETHVAFDERIAGHTNS